jgi:alkanesulfonate monooxygenase SsuD/methylene tetrahydromethanopterin reductase-like flavin-dependent oxidoreductase (luciferase family)
MVDLSISVEGVHGVGWPQWRRLVRTVEDLGFTGLYFSDHLVMVAPPDHPSLELVVALTYLADHTDRVRFGSMVSPLSLRDPVMLARQAAAIDELSGGRMVLGLGTGWMEREHTMFGYDLGDVPTRFKRFAEGLEVITRLLRSSEPVDFMGEFFQLRGAALPGPARPGGPEIQIGGQGPKRTLPLVARYADAWNAHVIGPEELRERNALLDTLLEAEGRKPGDVRRTFNVPVFCGHTRAEIETRLSRMPEFAPWRGLSTDAILERLARFRALVGSPDEVVRQIRDFEAAGVTEISLQWFAPDDIEGLEVLAAEVLPQVASVAS